MKGARYYEKRSIKPIIFIGRRTNTHDRKLQIREMIEWANDPPMKRDSNPPAPETTCVHPSLLPNSVCFPAASALRAGHTPLKGSGTSVSFQPFPVTPESHYIHGCFFCMYFYTSLQFILQMNLRTVVWISGD